MGFVSPEDDGASTAWVEAEKPSGSSVQSVTRSRAIRTGTGTDGFVNSPTAWQPAVLRLWFKVPRILWLYEQPFNDQVEGSEPISPTNDTCVPILGRKSNS